jgi:UDP-N-acetylmuramoyl-L-alanyl-D-glutamate--2,6-diaminopimelate ligase
MGGIAEQLADHVILTSDNPRTEDPDKIIDAIEAGMQNRTHERIEDRRAAIARAIETADRERDIVLLAGKGHETYQVRGTERFPFDEAEIVHRILADVL